MSAPKIWPEQGEDYANHMPATELRAGDVFYIGGKNEVPGQARVLNTVELGRESVFALISIPRSHEFDHVQRTPQGHTPEGGGPDG